jgi:hypothetical protein
MIDISFEPRKRAERVFAYIVAGLAPENPSIFSKFPIGQCTSLYHLDTPTKLSQQSRLNKEGKEV